LIMVTGLVMIYLFCKGIFLSDLFKRIDEHQSQIQDKDQQLKILLDESAKLQLAVESHSASQILKEIKERKEALESLAQDKSKYSNQFVSPEQMNQLFKSLYVDQAGINLGRVHNLPVQPFKSNTANTDGQPLFFKHSLVIEFTGNKEGILHYLKSLESLDYHLVFESLSLSEVDANSFHATLTLYTVSEQKDWLKL